MTIKERYHNILTYFQEHVPNAETELIYDNPFQLLVSVVLSAQCTDKRVNMVTPHLFVRFPDAYQLSQATVEEVFEIIRSISYPNNKAKHLVGLGKMLVEKYGGEVPLTVEELIFIPGVGRKTANVITSVLDNQPNMAVDTHVYRVSRRIGLVPMTANTPLKVENILIKYIPKSLVHIAHHWFILHGRYTCLARKPLCASCPINVYCKYYEQQQKNERNA
jgi:endonuclease-3